MSRIARALLRTACSARRAGGRRWLAGGRDGRRSRGAPCTQQRERAAGDGHCARRGGFDGDPARYRRARAAASAGARDDRPGRGDRGDRIAAGRRCWPCLLFRTDVLGRRLVLAAHRSGGVRAAAACTRRPGWVRSGNVGPRSGVRRPADPGRPHRGRVVHALAALPWVVLIVGVGLCAVEPELEESALLDYRPSARLAAGHAAPGARCDRGGGAGGRRADRRRHDRHRPAPDSHLRRGSVSPVQPGARAGRSGACRAAAACRAWRARSSDRRPVACAARPGAAGLVVCPGTRLARSAAGGFPCGVLLVVLVGNAIALPIYSLVWRAGRVGGRATLGQPPVWSLSGLMGTLRFAADEIWEPLQASLVWTAVAATLAVVLAGGAGMGDAAGRSLWRIDRPGDARPHAGGARSGRRHGPGPGLPCDPAIYDSPAMIVMAETLRSLPYALALALAVSALVSPRLSRRGGTRRRRPVGPDLPRRAPAFAPGAPGGLGDRLRIRPGRAAGDEPGRAAGHAADVGLDLGSLAHRASKATSRASRSSCFWSSAPPACSRLSRCVRSGQLNDADLPPTMHPAQPTGYKQCADRNGQVVQVGQAKPPNFNGRGAGVSYLRLVNSCQVYPEGAV